MFRGILAALGLVNFGFGILAAIEPELVAGWIGFELQAPSAFGEMRAVFGGAVMVIGVLFIVAMVVPRPAALLGALALVFTALSLGRVASLLVDGWSFYTLAAFALEAATAGFAALLWQRPELLQAEADEVPPLAQALEEAESASPDEAAAGTDPDRDES